MENIVIITSKESAAANFYEILGIAFGLLLKKKNREHISADKKCVTYIIATRPDELLYE